MSSQTTPTPIAHKTTIALKLTPQEQREWDPCKLLMASVGFRPFTTNKLGDCGFEAIAAQVYTEYSHTLPEANRLAIAHRMREELHDYLGARKDLWAQEITFEQETKTFETIFSQNLLKSPASTLEENKRPAHKFHAAYCQLVAAKFNRPVIAIQGQYEFCKIKVDSTEETLPFILATCKIFMPDGTITKLEVPSTAPSELRIKGPVDQLTEWAVAHTGTTPIVVSTFKGIVWEGGHYVPAPKE